GRMMSATVRPYRSMSRTTSWTVAPSARSRVYAAATVPYAWAFSRGVDAVEPDRQGPLGGLCREGVAVGHVGHRCRYGLRRERWKGCKQDRADEETHALGLCIFFAISEPVGGARDNPGALVA